MMQFFMAMVPPTATHQEKQVRVVKGKPVFYEPTELKSARSKLMGHLAEHKPVKPMKGAVQLLCKWCFPLDKGGQHRNGQYKTSKPDTDNLQKLLKDGMDLRYMVWRDELRKLKAVVNSPEYTEMLDAWKTVRVLYIDDFFKSARNQYGRMQPSEADARIAFELLNYRSNDKQLLTIISSELSLDEIADIDEATAGRIAQHAAGHCLTVAPDRGKNYRLRGVVSL